MDWGNAAVGAALLGEASLAYRSAARLDPRLDRAAQNLGWLEKQLPDWAQAEAGSDPLRTFLIWPAWLNPAELLLAGGGVFALAVVLLLLRRRQLNPLAALLGLVWLSLVAASAFDLSGPSLAVIQSEAGPLRAADSPGAPAVTAEWMPEGAAVHLLRIQGDWVEVALASGRRGWLPARAVAVVGKPPGGRELP